MHSTYRYTKKVKSQMSIVIWEKTEIEIEKSI